MNIKRLLSLVFGLLAAFPLTAMAAKSTNGAERVQTGRDIWVQPGETTGDVTCLGCSIHVRGAVTSDAFACGGRIVVEQGGSIAGDAATVAGNISVDNGGSIGGDAAAIGGAVQRLPQGVIGGDVDSLGSGWLVVMALVPLVMLGALIALIVWLVQRSKRIHAVPSAA